MNKRRIVVLTIIFLGAALLGREYRLEMEQESIPKAKKVAAPGTRSTFAAIHKEEESSAQIENTADAAEQIKQVIANLNAKMPAKSELQQLGEHAVHHMPVSLAELAEELGNVKQIITDNPNDTHVVGEAIAFYRNCSAQNHWPSSVRALCLANLHEVAGESLDSAPVELYRLARLAAEFPES